MDSRFHEDTRRPSTAPLTWETLGDTVMKDGIKGGGGGQWNKGREGEEREKGRGGRSRELNLPLRSSRKGRKEEEELTVVSEELEMGALFYLKLASDSAIG